MAESGDGSSEPSPSSEGAPPPKPDDDGSTIALLRGAGLLDARELPTFTALTGGVASDIWRVTTRRGDFVIKRALAKLRVAADWRAPVERNADEAAWFQTVGAFLPRAVPEVLFVDRDAGLFAMTFFPPGEYPVWKTMLADGRIEAGFAASVGASIARIHNETAEQPELAKRFDNAPTFHSIRLEPYIEATAAVHPVLAPGLMKLSEETGARRIALTHGDVSPKNILAGPGGPVFLDAECANYGDPAFDIAFCLNHLLLKCAWKPQHATQYLEAFDALSDAYTGAVEFEPRDRIEARAAALLPVLLLARIDGKSPVEYLTGEDVKSCVRSVAIELVESAPRELAAIRRRWAAAYL